MRNCQIQSVLLVAVFSLVFAIAMPPRDEVRLIFCCIFFLLQLNLDATHFALQAPGRREVTILGYKCIAADCHHKHTFTTKTAYMRHKGLRRNVGTPCWDPKNGRQIVSRASADADRPVLLSIPISAHLEGTMLVQQLTTRILRNSLLTITHHYSPLHNLPLHIITHHYTT